MVSGGLVEKVGSVAEYQGSVGHAFRQSELTVVLAAQLCAEPSAIGRAELILAPRVFRDLAAIEPRATLNSPTILSG